MNYKLKKLSSNDGHEIYNMLQEIPSENGYVNAVHGMIYERYKKWLVSKEKSSMKTEIEEGWRVPTTFYWLYVNDKPVGVGKLRHFLTDKLREEGGHIGYAIKTTERNKGYGTIMLKFLIEEAKKKDIKEILLTVRNENTYSIKVCLNNDGIITKANDVRNYILINLQ